MSAYRELAVMEAPVVMCGQENRVQAGNGYLVRRVPCPTPGWWDRLISGVRRGDTWVCNRCGAKWVWDIREFTISKWYPLR